MRNTRSQYLYGGNRFMVLCSQEILSEQKSQGAVSFQVYG